MKRIILLGILLTAFFIGVGQTLGQDADNLESTPRSFQTFFSKFKTAVVKKRKTVVASMSVFPFRYGYDAGNEGKYTRNQFIKNFGMIFSGDTPIFDPANIEFSCDAKECSIIDSSDASIYNFRKHGKTYKFVSYMVLP